MHRRGVVALALAFVLLASPTTVALLAAEPAGAASTSGSDEIEAADRPNVEIVIDVQPDGDTRWTVTTYVELSSENDTQAFRDQAQRWRNYNLELGYDAELFRRFARVAEEATGRDMRISRANRTTDIVDDGQWGALRLSFTWTNFARRDGDQLVIDDAFQSESGTWLQGLSEDQRLVIKPPDGFTFQSHPQGAGLENGSLIWEGPTSFSPTYFTEHPIVFRADGDVTVTPTQSATPTPSPPTTTVPPGNPNGSQGLLLGIVAALLLGGGLALYRWLGDERLPGGSPGGASATDGGEGGEATAETANAEPASPTEPEPEPEPTPEDPFAGVDEELLSDEERVLRLLEANGGRMKQANIVKETGWSNAKVSQLLSAMDDEDDIDKLRIGRENLISLPDVDVGEVE